MTLHDSPHVDGELLPVFVYGTLQPGEVRWFALEGRVLDESGEPDHVVGQLWDTGLGYPALTLDGTSLCPGHVIRLAPSTAVETWRDLVAIEGGVDSTYQPAIITTVSGVRALAFPYGSSPPPHFRPITRWRLGPHE